MYAAYADLPGETKARIDPLKVTTNSVRAEADRRLDPASRRDGGDAEGDASAGAHYPETAAIRSILNPTRMERIVGLERAESDLLDQLIVNAIEPKYQYQHV